MSTEKLSTATVLAFERKLDPSDALFSAGSWSDREVAGDWPHVPLREKSVRGTISNRLKTKDQDPAKLDAAIENPNLQTVDVATLPESADTLKVQFTLRVLAGAGQPSACNSAAYAKRLGEVVTSYRSQHGFGELAGRYAHNLASGRFLWRNRVGAEAVDVRIERLVDGAAQSTWAFEALDLPLRSFDAPENQKSKLSELAAAIEAGLNGDAHTLLRITAFVRFGAGQEVYPSQELILERGRGDKSKTLYHVNGVAAMHSQKLGNALRAVDTWYPEAELMGPIAAEPYGSVTTQGTAYRQPKAKVDFYNLLDNWLLKDQAPEVGDQHFVMAILIRGGVFGAAG